MIVLDTHVWLWWVHGSDQLPASARRALDVAEVEGLGVSIISCWEIAELVQLGRIDLPVALEEWLTQALDYPGIELLDLSVPVVLGSTRLPGAFHRDPADQLIVATARFYDCRVATADRKILAYPHVDSLKCR